MNKVCKIDLCDKKHYAKGYCGMHYLRVWKTGSPGSPYSTYKSRLRHGLDGHELQSTWEGMMQRCYNPSHEGYKNYGGRGVKVCKRWWHFANFVEDVGEKPSALHTIDRVDNNKGYNLENFKWSTRKEQAQNRRKRITKEEQA